MNDKIEIEMLKFSENSETRAEIKSNYVKIKKLEEEIDKIKDEQFQLREIYDMEFEIHKLECQLKLANEGCYFTAEHSAKILELLPRRINDIKSDLKKLKLK